jgi:phage regulator Rha-like protein
MMTKEMDIVEEAIINRIYFIRGQKIMIDRDLAELYGVQTKRLKEAVRRQINRFPPDFMFELNIKEMERWRTQFATSDELKKGLRYRSFCFTEQGVTMLSCILNTERAIEVNIRIIRVFTKMREVLSDQKDLLIKFEQMEKNLIKQFGRMQKNEDDIQVIFKTLKVLLKENNNPRPRVGFRRSDERE